MRWRNSFLSILLTFHYTSCTTVVAQFPPYSPNGGGSHYNKNNKNSRGNQSSKFKYQKYAKNSFNSDFSSSSVNCVNNNLNSTLCYDRHYSYYDQYQYGFPSEMNSINSSESGGHIKLPFTESGGQGFHEKHNSGWNSNLQIQNQPVLYYADPMRSRVDKAHIPESDSKGHDHSHHAESHADKGHGHHGEMGGWSHKQEHHHHKKKKGKKSILGKVLKKFKLKHKKEKLIWKEVPKCDGFENFIKDLEIISWGLGWAGFIPATIGLILHFLNQVYLTFSVIKIGLPERLATFIEIFFPNTVPEMLKLMTEVVALIDYAFTFIVSYPLGNKIVVIEFIAEILTIGSLALATITIFDDIVEDKVWAIFGIDLREVFEGYGCHNPFDKQKKIENFFEKFQGSGWH